MPYSQDIEERIRTTIADLAESKRLAAIGVEESVVKKVALEARLLLLRKRLRYEPVPKRRADEHPRKQESSW